MPDSGKVEGQNWGCGMTPLLLLAMVTALPTVCGELQTTRAGLPSLNVKHPDDDQTPSTMADASGDEIQSGITVRNNVLWALHGKHQNHSTKTPVRSTVGNRSLSPVTMVPSNEGQNDLDSEILLSVILLVGLLLIIVFGVALLIWKRRKSRSSRLRDIKEEEIFEGDSAEKVPMPMFEDDVPSVLELEMEDLEKWMTKDSVGSGLDSIKEN